MYCIIMYIVWMMGTTFSILTLMTSCVVRHNAFFFDLDESTRTSS